MNIRPCEATDLPDVLAIYAHHVLTGFGTFEVEPPSPDEMKQRFDGLRQGGFPFLVTEADQRIVGYAYAGPFRPRIAYRHTCESSVYVAHDRSRRGVGQALMLAVIADCQSKGLRQMLAVIGDSENQASIGLHARLGFEHIGVFKNVGFKFGRWVDIVLMQRAL